MTRKDVQAIRKALREGVEISSIAARFHLSETTVGAIADGWTPTFKRGRPPKKKPEKPPEKEEFVIPAVDFLQPPRRCPTCGALVFLPCVFCALTRHLQALRVRGKTTTRPVDRHTGPSKDPGGLNLHGAVRKRYEALRKLKEAEAAKEWEDRQKNG